jgi:glycosyltransferase involved in cell wall biosynthesis
LDLSIIVPFANEYPSIRYTLDSIMANCVEIPFSSEVILVNNFCRAVERQGFAEDDGWRYLKDFKEKNDVPWLTLLHYEEKLSHWNARNFGVKHSTGNILFFLDGHVILPPDQLEYLLWAYQHHVRGEGSLHLPISNLNDLPNRKNIYRMRVNRSLGVLHYVFHHFDMRTDAPVLEVPCMSACGLMISREIWDHMEGYPQALGIYGGGENYMNFALPLLGYKHFVLQTGNLKHLNAPRGYRFDGIDWLRNRLIAAFLIGGNRWAEACMSGMLKAKKASGRSLRGLLEEVVYNSDLIARRDRIEDAMKITLDEWIEGWRRTEFFEEVSEWV